jgi:hypothetical protein
LLVILRLGKALGTFGIPLLARFVRKYSSDKEVLSK